MVISIDAIGMWVCEFARGYHSSPNTSLVFFRLIGYPNLFDISSETKSPTRISESAEINNFNSRSIWQNATQHILQLKPMVICYIAIENCPVEIVDLPIDSMMMFHSFVNVYQRVSIGFMMTIGDISTVNGIINQLITWGAPPCMVKITEHISRSTNLFDRIHRSTDFATENVKVLHRRGPRNLGHRNIWKTKHIQ